MTINYNDGNWHGWNGGECPVHPKSKVEVVIRDPEGLIRSNAGYVQLLRWEYLEGYPNIIAFRVVKEHREPRDFWLDTVTQQVFYSEVVSSDKRRIVHVREVLE